MAKMAAGGRGASLKILCAVLAVSLIIGIVSVVLLVVYKGQGSSWLEEVENGYTVTFKDYDGAVLKTQTVETGKAATAPSAPSRDGYAFSGWDKAFENITADLVVTAVYKQIPTGGPKICVESVTAEKGQSVQVAVRVENNPGVAGAKIALAFDDGLTLTAASEDEAFGVLDYTEPAGLRNGCFFNWDSLYAESRNDGTILLLTFEVPADAASGTVYGISFSYRHGDIYNVDLNDMTVEMIAGSITVK